MHLLHDSNRQPQGDVWLWVTRDVHFAQGVVQSSGFEVLSQQAHSHNANMNVLIESRKPAGRECDTPDAFEMQEQTDRQTHQARQTNRHQSAINPSHESPSTAHQSPSIVHQSPTVIHQLSINPSSSIANSHPSIVHQSIPPWPARAAVGCHS